MTCQAFWKHPFTCSGLSVLLLLLHSWAPLRAQANRTLGAPAIVLQTRLQLPPLPDTVGAPTGRRRGGAQRDACFTNDRSKDQTARLSVVAVVPKIQQGIWGLTHTAHPTFWFYVDPAGVPSVPMTFVLQDAQDAEIYRTPVTVTSREAGVLKITLPSTLVPLTINQRYTWTFWLNCNHEHVQGNIYRVSKEQVPVAPEHLSPLAQVSHYTDWGIWHDALTHVANLRQQDPDNGQYQQVWQSLLTQVDLQSVASAPLLSDCQPQPSETSEQASPNMVQVCLGELHQFSRLRDRNYSQLPTKTKEAQKRG